MDLAENQLEQFPECLRFLQSLISRNIVVAAAEREKKRVGSRRLQLIESRTSSASSSRPNQENREPLRNGLSRFVHTAVAESLHAIGPHSVSDVWTCRHIALELSDAIFFVGGFNLGRLALHDDQGVLLLVIDAYGEDHKIGTRLAAPRPTNSTSIAPFRTGIPSRETWRFPAGHILPAFPGVGSSVNEIKDFALLNDDGELWWSSLFHE